MVLTVRKTHYYLIEVEARSINASDSSGDEDVSRVPFMIISAKYYK